jgi:transposase
MDITPPRRRYPSDLTQPEWAQVQRFIPAPKPGGRPAVHDRREIVNALLYVARTGCRWRALPHDLPPWGTVYWYFLTWKKDGTLDRLHDELRGDLRLAEGRSHRQPSAAVIDSQSVKTTERGARAASMRGRGSRAASGTCSWTPSA